MDYKKKYEEALERARALHAEAISKGYPRDYVKEYETVFPELAESYDDIIREELVEAFAVYGKDSFWKGIPIKSILAWLKKQKPVDTTEIAHCINCPVYEKAEWSEDDEKCLQELMQHIEHCVTVYGASQPEWQRWLNLLNSLRPQPRWKPSKEQMDSLNYGIYVLEEEGYDAAAREIKELYEQLKKLKEE